MDRSNLNKMICRGLTSKKDPISLCQQAKQDYEQLNFFFFFYVLLISFLYIFSLYFISFFFFLTSNELMDTILDDRLLFFFLRDGGFTSQFMTTWANPHKFKPIWTIHLSSHARQK